MQVILTEEEYSELKKNRKEKSAESECIRDMDRFIRKALIGIEPSIDGMSKMIVFKIPETQIPSKMMHAVNARLNQPR